MKEWMAQADPPKDNTVKTLNRRWRLLFSNKTTFYFKEWTTVNCALTKLAITKFFITSYRSRFLNVV